MTVGDLLDVARVNRKEVPLVRQSEGAECALACVAMVAAAHGRVMDLGELRTKYPISQRGLGLRALMDIAEDLGMSATPLRSEIAQVSNVALPAIVHWDLTHFVVLTRIRRHGLSQVFTIHDPSRGRLDVSREAFSKGFTGVVIEIVPGPEFRREVHRTRTKLSDLWASISGLRSIVAQVVVLSVVLNAFSAITPLFMQTAVDVVLPNEDYRLLNSLFLGFILLALISTSVSWLRARILTRATQLTVLQIATNVAAHLVWLPLRWFEKRHTGDVLSRLGSTQYLSEFIARGIVTLVVDGALFIAMIAMIYVFSVPLGIFSTISAIVFLAIKLSPTAALNRINTETIANQAAEASSLIETVQGIAAVKSFSAERNRLRIWRTKKMASTRSAIRLEFFRNLIEAWMSSAIAVENLTFIFLSIELSLRGELSVGALFALMAYKVQIVGSISRAAQLGSDYIGLNVHLERIGDIVQTEPNGARNLPRFSAVPQPSIELRDVWFSYGTHESPVLRGADAHFSAGQSIAIVGASGAGKTTLLKLVAGLLDADRGEILIGGERQSSTLRTGRGAIGYVAQDDKLFSGSLAENIAFFDADLDFGRVREAARLAMIDGDIERMPMKYETRVGDLASGLSGGQMARIFLARALYNRPSILLMDEGTANLDLHTERQVNASIASLGITRILAAHRPETIGSADRVFLVEGGQLAEQSR